MKIAENGKSVQKTENKCKVCGLGEIEMILLYVIIVVGKPIVCKMTSPII